VPREFEVVLGRRRVRVAVVFRTAFERASALVIERYTPHGVLSDTFHLLDARLTREKVVAVDGAELLAVVRSRAHLERVLKNHLLPLYAEEEPESITVTLA
jgi:hypothetical protein